VADSCPKESPFRMTDCRLPMIRRCSRNSATHLRVTHEKLVNIVLKDAPFLLGLRLRFSTGSAPSFLTRALLVAAEKFKAQQRVEAASDRYQRSSIPQQLPDARGIGQPATTQKRSRSRGLAFIKHKRGSSTGEARTYAVGRSEGLNAQILPRK